MIEDKPEVVSEAVPSLSVDFLSMDGRPHGTVPLLLPTPGTVPLLRGLAVSPLSLTLLLD